MVPETDTGDSPKIVTDDGKGRNGEGHLIRGVINRMRNRFIEASKGSLVQGLSI